MTTLTDIQANIRNRFATKSAWAAYADSEMVAQLSDLMGALVHEMLQEIETARMDSFLATATSRQAVLAHAAERNYLPPRPRAPAGVISITNLNSADVEIPEKTKFLDTEGNSYYTKEFVKVYGTTTEPVAVEHLTREEKVFAGESVEFQEVVVCDWQMVDASFLVRNTADPSQTEPLEVFHDLYEVTPEMWGGMWFYNVDDTWCLRLGNGDFGKMLMTGQELVADIWLTDPAKRLVTGSRLFQANALTDVLGFAANLDAQVSQPIGKGFFRSSTERIRMAAQRHANYRDRMVWADDYIHVLKESIPDLSFVNVWGEAEQQAQDGGMPNMENFNRVYVSAFSVLDNTNISLKCLDILEKYPHPLTIKYTYVETEEQPFDLRISGILPYGANRLTFENDLKVLLLKHYGKTSLERRETFELPTCYDMIISSGLLDVGTDRSARRKLHVQITSGEPNPEKLNSMLFLDNLDLAFENY